MNEKQKEVYDFIIVKAYQFDSDYILSMVESLREELGKRGVVEWIVKNAEAKFLASRIIMVIFIVRNVDF